MPPSSAPIAYTLLVIDQPAQPIRYVFVHDRSGDVLTLRAAFDEGGATVTSTADAPAVRFTGGGAGGDGAPVVKRTEGNSESEVLIEGDRMVFEVGKTNWTVSRPTERRLEVVGPPSVGRTIAEHSTGSLDRRSATYDVWAIAPPQETTAILRLIVESLTVTRLLSLAPPVHLDG